LIVHRKIPKNYLEMHYLTTIYLLLQAAKFLLSSISLFRKVNYNFLNNFYSKLSNYSLAIL